MTHKFIIIILYAFLNQWHLVAQSELALGIIGKLEFNKFNTIQNNDNITRTKFQSNPQTGLGLYVAHSLGKRLFIDASVLLSRAKYNLNYTQGNITFINADIRFTQVNLNLNYIINPNAEKAKIFIFAGIQNLYRRWGEENYINSVLSNSYWPSNRLQTQCGLGTRIYASHSNLFIQPFAGLRFSGSQQIIYDTPNNQVFAGIVIGFKSIKNKKNRYNKCPTEF